VELRPYQKEAVSGCINALRENSSAVVVMPTGCGKTIVFAETIRIASKRCMVIAHREELIRQAAKKVEVVTRQRPSIEMAEEKSYERDNRMRSKVVVASVQTLNAKTYLGHRMEKFNPNDFSLLIIDEAHHAVAQTYRRVIDHFQRNGALKVIGVSATPDRADKLALGEVFDVVAYKYELADSIRDGWLVPIHQRIVRVESLDFSKVNRVAGDLNQRQLAEVMEYEKNLHGIATPTLELTGDRKTIVFASSVAHAERLAEIFNRHKPTSARMVCGKTPKDIRAGIVSDYAAGKFQYLVNVGIATEGFDDPSVEVIVMARPSCSRALVAQMVGRGTRPLPDLVDSKDTPQERRDAIASSAKPHCEVVDFVGNSTRHQLVYAADILGGVESKAAERVIEKQKEDEDSTPIDVLDELQRAEEELQKEKEEQLAVEKRSVVTAKVKYKSADLDPFDVLQINAPRTVWTGAPPLSTNQRAMLTRNGISVSDVDHHTQRVLFKELVRRRKNNLCTYKQAKLMRKYGYTGNESFERASEIIDNLAANNWKKS
jgi:superfamily II DNA or RNA helicase